MHKFFDKMAQLSTTKFKFLLLLLPFLLAGCTVTADPNQALIEHNIDVLAQIIQNYSLITGIGMFLASLFRFKRYSEQKTMMMKPKLAAPVMLMLGSMMLMMLPTVVSSSVLSFWGHVSPMAYQNPSDTKQISRSIILLLRLMGVVSFIRGIFSFVKSGHESAQPGMVAKGCMYMIGGVLMVHIVETADIVGSFFGVHFS